MKRFFYSAAALSSITILFCCLNLLRAGAQSTSKETAPATMQQTETQRAAADQQERIDHYNQLVRDQQQLVRDQEDRAKRVESLLERQEQLMTKQEAAFTRFEKILDTWEQQQKQYQKYLDSLKK